jgi:xanthine dehydrogenase YagR molybdenum-binding subunit
MRAPAELPYLFALESAMDELAYALRMDPVELRRVNDTQFEPIKGLPYTSRALMPCFDAAAAAFGWHGRNAEPGSMRDGDWLIGWGCASTMYPTQMAPAAARVTLTPAGGAKVETATHEIGTGVMTVLALTVAQELGVPIDRIDVRVGDSNLPPSPVAGGSNSTASLCNVVAKACQDIAGRIARAAVAQGSGGPFMGADPATLRLVDGQLRDTSARSEPIAIAAARVQHGAIEAYAENVPHGVPPEGAAALYRGKAPLAGGAKLKDRVQFAFGAHFVEVRVHAMTREVRAPRAVGAFAAGRIVNPKTARSQLMGGQIWGIGAALHEVTEIDRKTARYYNDDLAEYLIPVNADIGTVETIFLPESDDKINALGIKGVGELGNVGLNAAVANAVFHATGIRVRELPIRIEKLLAV